MNHGHRAMPSDLRVAESFPVIKPAPRLDENGPAQTAQVPETAKSPHPKRRTENPTSSTLNEHMTAPFVADVGFNRSTSKP